MNDLISRKALIEKICSTQINKTEGELLKMPPSYWEGVNDKQISIINVIAALEAQQADMWIPVTESLPEIGSDYLVTMQQDNVFHGKPFVNWASYDGNFYDSIDGTIFDNVIAWRPLTEPYDPLAEKIQKVLDREHDRISGKI